MTGPIVRSGFAMALTLAVLERVITMAWRAPESRGAQWRLDSGPAGDGPQRTLAAFVYKGNPTERGNRRKSSISCKITADS
jgi:hypothetical protein